MESSGWTEYEYWEKVFDVYKNAFIKGKYINTVLKPRFDNENKDMPESEYNTSFTEYLEEYKSKLINP